MKISKKLISLSLAGVMAFAMSFSVGAASSPKTPSIPSSICKSAAGNWGNPVNPDIITAKLSPPYYTLQNKVKAMFGQDPGIVVTNITNSGNGLKFDVNVNDSAKAEAIKTILKSPVSLGNILVTINVKGPDGKEAGESDLDPATMLKTAFSGNPIFGGVQASQFYPCYFCIFSKPVIQFYNDDLSSYNGYFTALTSDVAKEILVTRIYDMNINYCISTNS